MLSGQCSVAHQPVPPVASARNETITASVSCLTHLIIIIIVMLNLLLIINVIQQIDGHTKR